MDDKGREIASQIIKALNKALDETAPGEFKSLGGVQIGDGAIAKIIPAISAYGDEREREVVKKAAHMQCVFCREMPNDPVYDEQGRTHSRVWTGCIDCQDSTILDSRLLTP